MAHIEDGVRERIEQVVGEHYPYYLYRFIGLGDRKKKDPASLYIDDILKITDHIAYFSTEQFHYYGIICSGSFTMVTGPTMPVANTRQELRTLAFRLNIGAGDIEDFITGMYNISMMPLESVIQMLCTINYVLNNEKKTLGDVMPIITEEIAQDLGMSRSWLSRSFKKESGQNLADFITPGEGLRGLPAP